MQYAEHACVYPTLFLTLTKKYSDTITHTNSDQRVFSLKHILKQMFVDVLGVTVIFMRISMRWTEFECEARLFAFLFGTNALGERHDLSLLFE